MNSCTVSGEKLTIVRARLTPVLLVPSAIIWVLSGRPPPTLRLQPGTRRDADEDRILAARVARDVGQGQGQIEHAAVDQRHVLNLALGDRAAGGAGFGVDHRRFGIDGHLGVDRARLHRDVHRGVAGRIDLHVVDDLLLEAGGLHLDPVGDRLEILHASTSRSPTVVTLRTSLVPTLVTVTLAPAMTACGRIENGSG